MPAVWTLTGAGQESQFILFKQRKIKWFENVKKIKNWRQISQIWALHGHKNSLSFCNALKPTFSLKILLLIPSVLQDFCSVHKDLNFKMQPGIHALVLSVFHIMISCGRLSRTGAQSTVELHFLGPVILAVSAISTWEVEDKPRRDRLQFPGVSSTTY